MPIFMVGLPLIFQLQLLRDQFVSLQADMNMLQGKYTALQKLHREQEQTLVEMAEQMAEKALKVAGPRDPCLLLCGG